ncbi:MAG: SLC13 family permease [Chromatocurvus sp.]
MLEQLLIAGIFLCLFYGLIFTSIAPAWLFTLAMSACYLAGMVSTEELLDKAANTGLVTLILLLLVSVGLEKLSWLERLSSGLVTAWYRRSLLRLGIITAVFSAFVNNTAVVATLANSVRTSRHHLPSKLLMPLSFAAILGGTMTLIGTSTNLIVSSFLEDVSGTGLSFFVFLPVGGAATLVGLLVIILFSRLLPENATGDVDVNEYLVEAEVAEDSPLAGRSIADNGLRDLDALFLVEIVRDEHLISPVAPQEMIEAGDKLIFSGDISQVSLLEKFAGLKLFATEEGLLRGNLTEVILLPGATVEGKTIKDSGFRSLFDAAVVGMRRGGKRLSGKLGGITLQAGDSLMLAVGADFATRRNVDKNFLVVDQNGIRSTNSTLQDSLISGGMLLVVALGAMGVVPLVKGVALLLVAMLALGIVRGSELARRFPFGMWLIIASALTLSQALSNTGLVTELSALLHSGLSGHGPYVALVGVYLGTLVMTELMTNNAAAALAFPIAYGLAQSYGVDPMPFAMAVAFGASASFLTPYGYTTNLMVQNLGGYTLAHYFRYGLPLSIAYSATVLLLLPRFFPFLPQS